MIRKVLEADLPADLYSGKVFDAKVQAVFDHVVSAYGDDGSVYVPAQSESAQRHDKRAHRRERR